VIAKVDGHDAEEIKSAIERAKAETHRPTLICCKTIIGKGAPNKQGKEESHGAPLGDTEIAAARQILHWPHAPFEIPKEIYTAWDGRARGTQLERNWQTQFDAYRNQYPELAAEFERREQGRLPADFAAQADAFIQQCQSESKTVATRKASEICLNFFGPMLPELLGGSADLAGSNNTIWKGCKSISAEDAGGNYLHYGVREFGMSAIMNGLTLHHGFKAYGATFLVFMEYARNAVRMAALMKQPSIFVYTHDSIGLGEDGPTHQPIEQLASLRGTPHLHTWRPCDMTESAVAWRAALERTDGPSALIFTRQNLPHQARDAAQVAAAAKGAYVLRDCAAHPEAILIATGSEVQLAMAAAEQLAQNGRQVRVVSMPCSSVFDAQDAAYRESVLPSDVLARVAVEAAHKDFWYKYVGLDGAIVGMEGFGESAPGPQLMEYFGFTVDAVVEAVVELLDI
jgi:transketolase